LVFGAIANVIQAHIELFGPPFHVEYDDNYCDRDPPTTDE